MRTYRPLPYDAKERVSALLGQTKTKADFQRVLCVWLRIALDLTTDKIAMAIGWKRESVRQIHSNYLKHGETALIGTGRGGRYRQNLTVEEEDQLLAPFFAKAASGGILVANEVKAAYEERVGRAVPKSTVYRMLARHGWRKIAPRRKHPEADEEKREAFKKTPGDRRGRDRAAEGT